MTYDHFVTETNKLAAYLEIAVRIDEALRRATTNDVRTVPAIDLGAGNSIPAPGRFRLIEDFSMARRTYSTIHFLMLCTGGASTAAGDFTEDSGVLMRRLLELLAQVSWLTDHDPPTGLDLPKPFANLNSLAIVASEADWPDGPGRTEALCHIAATIDWVDIQALRSDLEEIDQQIKTTKSLAAATNDTDTATRLRHDVIHLKARDRLTHARLEEMGAPTTARHNFIDLLAKGMPTYVAAYRYESDSAHGRAMGRRHQRGTAGDPTLGAPSPAWRREFVMATSNGAMLALGSRCLAFLGASTTELGALGAEHDNLVSEQLGNEQS